MSKLYLFVVAQPATFRFPDVLAIKKRPASGLGKKIQQPINKAIFH